jgi:hypothetical protein
MRPCPFADNSTGLCLIMVLSKSRVVDNMIDLVDMTMKRDSDGAWGQGCSLEMTDSTVRESLVSSTTTPPLMISLDGGLSKG